MLTRVVIVVVTSWSALIVAACAAEPSLRTAPKADVNEHVRNSTVDGLVVALKINGKEITLESAVPARIPRIEPLPKEIRNRITVAASMQGRNVSTIAVQDPVIVVVEHEGEVKNETRQMQFGIPTPAAIDAIEVKLSTSGATARFGVHRAYEHSAASSQNSTCALVADGGAPPNMRGNKGNKG